MGNFEGSWARVVHAVATICFKGSQQRLSFQAKFAVIVVDKERRFMGYQYVGIAIKPESEMYSFFAMGSGRVLLVSSQDIAPATQ